jgi:hypothetical protein
MAQMSDKDAEGVAVPQYAELLALKQQCYV